MIIIFDKLELYRIVDHKEGMGKFKLIGHYLFTTGIILTGFFLGILLIPFGILLYLYSQYKISIWTEKNNKEFNTFQIKSFVYYNTFYNPKLLINNVSINCPLKYSLGDAILANKFIQKSFVLETIEEDNLTDKLNLSEATLKRDLSNIRQLFINFELSPYINFKMSYDEKGLNISIPLTEILTNVFLALFAIKKMNSYKKLFKNHIL